MRLLVGLITTDHTLRQLAAFLASLADHSWSQTELTVHVLLNHVRHSDHSVHYDGLHIVYHRVHADDSALPLSIGRARTTLNAILADQTWTKDTCAWILDDDHRFEAIVLEENEVRTIRPDYEQLLLSLAKNRPDVAIGTLTGSPPLPVPATVPLATTDLHVALTAIFGGARDWSQMTLAATDVDRAYYDELHHSFNRNCRLPPSNNPGECRCQMYIRECAASLRILAGELRYRPLLRVRQSIGKQLSREFIHRGGNTFVFNQSALADVPNHWLGIGDCKFRRADMLWCKLNASHKGRTVTRVDIPVLHDRSLVDPFSLSVSSIYAELQGWALLTATEMAIDGRLEANTLSEFSEMYLRLLSGRVERTAATWIEARQIAEGLVEKVSSEVQALVGGLNCQVASHSIEQVGLLVEQIADKFVPETLLDACVGHHQMDLVERYYSDLRQMLCNRTPQPL